VTSIFVTERDKTVTPLVETWFIGVMWDYILYLHSELSPQEGFSVS